MDLNRTSKTLLLRLKDRDDQDAWNQFYKRYTRFIIGFCRKRGCSETMCQDVLQETMIQVWKYILDFKYDSTKGRFRSYLFQIVVSQIRILSKNKLSEFPLMPLEGILENKISDQESESLQKIFDKLWNSNLMEEAFDRVKTRVDPLTWESFEKNVVDGMSPDEVSHLLKIKKNSVYQHKKRVQKLLKQELQCLETESAVV